MGTEFRKPGITSPEIITNEQLATEETLKIIRQIALGFMTPTVLKTGSKSVTTAGTRVELKADTVCRAVIITANAANTSYIYIGDNAVSSTVFMKKILAGDEFYVAIDNLNKIYLDAAVNAEGVAFGYLN